MNTHPLMSRTASKAISKMSVALFASCPPRPAHWWLAPSSLWSSLTGEGGAFFFEIARCRLKFAVIDGAKARLRSMRGDTDCAPFTREA
jgi:hypothetical protein